MGLRDYVYPIVATLVPGMNDWIEDREAHVANTFIEHTNRVRKRLVESRDTLHEVRAICLELTSGEHATSSRDFGRGVAFAAAQVTKTLTRQ